MTSKEAQTKHQPMIPGESHFKHQPLKAKNHISNTNLWNQENHLSRIKDQTTNFGTIKYHRSDNNIRHHWILQIKQPTYDIKRTTDQTPTNDTRRITDQTQTFETRRITYQTLTYGTRRNTDQTQTYDI